MLNPMDISFLVPFHILALQVILHQELVQPFCFLSECGKVKALNKTQIKIHFALRTTK